MSFSSSDRVATSVLDVAYESAGDPRGPAVILLHGFPYDVRAFDDVAPTLAAAGAHVLDMDALDLGNAVVAGYGWARGVHRGGASPRAHRRSWVRRRLQHPEPGLRRRALGAGVGAHLLVSVLLHSKRGRLGLERNRDELCELLWRTWSPTWAGAAIAFPATAPSLHTPDFVDVVIHSYRHRFGLVQGTRSTRRSKT